MGTLSGSKREGSSLTVQDKRDVINTSTLSGRKLFQASVFKGWKRYVLIHRSSRSTDSHFCVLHGFLRTRKADWVSWDGHMGALRRSVTHLSKWSRLRWSPPSRRIGMSPGCWHTERLCCTGGFRSSTRPDLREERAWQRSAMKTGILTQQREAGTCKSVSQPKPILF